MRRPASAATAGILDVRDAWVDDGARGCWIETMKEGSSLQCQRLLEIVVLEGAGHAVDLG
jgi:hypothetical protein